MKPELKGKRCLLATMHEKERAIAPPFAKLLGMEILSTPINSDLLGTFSGEVERIDTPLECAKKKCLMALEGADTALCVASEGSFGPHPSLPFGACDHEILFFMDKANQLHLHESVISLKTNYATEVVSSMQSVLHFAEKALFPSHALIVKTIDPSGHPLILKGIRSESDLEKAFETCLKASKSGLVSLQTDMRAHMNPTRMSVIAEVAQKLAERLAEVCPSCETPGWGLVDLHRGLECSDCGCETELVRAEIFGCSRCPYQLAKPRKDGLLSADPQYCLYCNP